MKQLALRSAALALAAAAAPALAGMATTLVIAMVDHGRATILSVGDSRAYLASGGALHPLTTDDSWVEHQVASGAMTRDEAERSPFRNAITKGVGVDEVLDPGEIVRTALVPGDALVLCSDGLYDMIEETEIRRTLLAHVNNLTGAAGMLIEMANEYGGEDNISAVVVKVVQSFPASPKAWSKLCAWF